VRPGSPAKGLVPDSLELVHVGRPVGLGIVKSAAGLGLFGCTVLGMFLITVSSGFGVFMGLLVPALWLVDWGSLMAADGITDLFARWRLGDVRPSRAMVLTAEGVRYAVVYTGAAGDADVIVRWDEITGSGFRRGPGGSLWFCLDALTEFPVPGELERAAVRELPPELVSRMASHWIDSVIADGAPFGRRRLLENMFWFGTPLAINLAVCPGASPGKVDRFLARHAPRGIRCVSAERAWWRPPALSRYLSPIGAMRPIGTGDE